MDEALELAEKGYNAGKDFLEDQLTDILKDAADELAEYNLPVLNWLQEITQIGDKGKALGEAIVDGDPERTLKALLELMVELSSFEAIIEKIKNRDIGSIVIYASAEVSGVISVSGGVGIAVPVDIYIHLIRNANRLYDNFSVEEVRKVFEEYNGSLFAFVGVAGVSGGAELGASANIMVGYHINKPEGIPGLAIDVSVSFHAEYGATMAVGFDPVSFFPPSLVQIIIGVGVGLDKGAGIGVSYCFNIAAVYSDLKVYAGPHALPVYPSAAEAKKEVDADVYWNKYSWEELHTHNQNLWGKLGWNSNNWDGPASNYPSTFTTPWNSLSSDQREAAKDLGYNERSWDFDATRGHDAQASGTPDGNWQKYYWADIAATEQNYWKKLGWSGDNWDNNSPQPSSVNKQWPELTQNEKLAANYLGYSSSTWSA